MSFGNWPPVGLTQYARVDQTGTILFQTSPAFVASVGNPNTGEYTFQFVAGEFDPESQSVFVTPADPAEPGGRPSLDVGDGNIDQAVVFMTDAAGAAIAQSFYLQLVKRVA